MIFYFLQYGILKEKKLDGQFKMGLMKKGRRWNYGNLFALKHNNFRKMFKFYDKVCFTTE